MAVYRHTFVLAAPLATVAAWHSSTQALHYLSPPPIIVQFQRQDPLQDGAISEFTLWFGPLPVRWRAEHSAVKPFAGFTDTQTVGPLRYWQHTHRFTALGPAQTQIEDVVEYEHYAGWRGWFSRVMFAPLMLRFIFFYREAIIRRLLAPALPKI